MKLITAHRILIGAAIAFFVFYTVVVLAHGRPGAVVQAVISAAVAVGLVLYFRTLSRWGRPPDVAEVAAPRGAAPAILIYDADCPVCRASALWLMRRALSGGALEILPCRSSVRRARFPDVTEAACLTAMHLVLPDGRVVVGADAAPEILRRVRGWGWLATLFALPGVRPLGRRVYAWIARNRMKLSCALPRDRYSEERP